MRLALALGPPLLGKTLTVRNDDVFAGERFDDLCLTELRVDARPPG